MAPANLVNKMGAEVTAISTSDEQRKRIILEHIILSIHGKMQHLQIMRES